MEETEKTPGFPRNLPQTPGLTDQESLNDTQAITLTVGLNKGPIEFNVKNLEPVEFSDCQKADTSSITNPPATPDPECTSNSQALQSNQNATDQSLIGQPLDLIKFVISQRLVDHTNLVAIVRFLKKHKLKESFEDKWARKKKKFVVDHLEKYIFGPNYTLSCLTFKGIGYSETNFINDIRIFQLTRDLEGAEQPQHALESER